MKSTWYDMKELTLSFHDSLSISISSARGDNRSVTAEEHEPSQVF